jgi:DNA-binding CsgD family transcriptional regulator
MSFTKPQCRRLTERLSPREREVLCLMAEGLATKQIAAQLRNRDGAPLSESTVLHYRERIYAKLAVNAIGPAVRMATLAGLL